jgi:hypothetical protein
MWAMPHKTPETFVPADVYIGLQQFYAYQMGLLDDGDVSGWAATFTRDAVFEDSSTEQPLRGRAAIEEPVRLRVAQLAAERRQFRHWFAMIDVLGQDAGRLYTRFYALAISTGAGGPTVVHGHLVCRDELISEGSRHLVARRSVAPDGH